MIGRREFITLLGGAAAAWAVVARAQQGERMRRISVPASSPEDDPTIQARLETLQHGLQQSGWTDGRSDTAGPPPSPGPGSDLGTFSRTVISALQVVS
jgi:hypothetical protein